MNTYEQLIEFINDRKKYFDAKIGEDKTYEKKKCKWNSECLMRYKNLVETLNNSNLQDKDNLIQMTYDIVFKDNVVNFHNVSGSHIKEIIQNFIDHPEKLQTHSDIREAFADFRKAVENEPIKPITMYKKLTDEPIEIQIAVKDQYGKIRKNEKESKQENILYSVSKDYLNLFIDKQYYGEAVETFFDNMYNFCEDGKDNRYSIPKQHHALVVTRDNNQENTLKNKYYTKTNVPLNEIKEGNKLEFLMNLYIFLLEPISLNLENLKKTSYPILKDETSNEREGMIFFVEKNNSSFWDVTNNFININNKFYLGKIEKKETAEEIRKNMDEEERDDLEKTTNAILDYYHMQKNYKSINSIFNFSEQPIDKNNECKQRLKTNIETIKETLEERYQGSIYFDISEIFIKLLNEQKYFYKLLDKDFSEENVQRSPEQEEYLCTFGNSLNNDEKEKILSSKFNPDNINKSLENYETILYNIAARVLDPHITEKQKEDYFKQLTVFYPDVYSSLIY